LSNRRALTHRTDVRVFFALWPDILARAQIAMASTDLHLAGEAQPVPRENFHMTLAFAGEVATRRLALLQRVGTAQRASGCTIKFDTYEYWPEPRVVVAVARESPPALIELAARLRAALNIPQSELPLRAHVTLARKVTQAPVLQAMSPFHWTARSFSLVRSDTSGPHSVYTVVDTWQLLDETPAL
jgi:2'-5' RNA ligase